MIYILNGNKSAHQCINTNSEKLVCSQLFLVGNGLTTCALIRDGGADQTCFAGVDDDEFGHSVHLGHRQLLMKTCRINNNTAAQSLSQPAKFTQQCEKSDESKRYLVT